MPTNTKTLANEANNQNGIPRIVNSPGYRCVNHPASTPPITVMMENLGPMPQRVIRLGSQKPKNIIRFSIGITIPQFENCLDFGNYVSIFYGTTTL